ncbi:hypothetical protein J7E88_32755 [Streptomyces sp. ISL-10]|uniref:hypothetical protein n=1 Tax=Streptomyces sp. ISL-10 TaxID=2819172 RepID=UPI001BEAECC4|nr:hypothetical protein [Streptomyces sp. ISL-10]MBT2369918.1 hypothetical protein [Streptomyces sp. ISL-10]
MFKFIEALSDRIVSFTAPAIDAEAAAQDCRNVYSHCDPQCTFWRNRLAYDKICDGRYVGTWYAACGTCAD